MINAHDLTIKAQFGQNQSLKRLKKIVPLAHVMDLFSWP
jgi:hypothetical protein